MPLNQDKTIRIIKEQCKGIDERCTGYRTEILKIVGDILFIEAQHKIKAINIQKKIDDKINATGIYLSKETSRE